MEFDHFVILCLHYLKRSTPFKEVTHIYSLILAFIITLNLNLKKKTINTSYEKNINLMNYFTSDYNSNFILSLLVIFFVLPLIISNLLPYFKVFKKNKLQ